MEGARVLDGERLDRLRASGREAPVRARSRRRPRAGSSRRPGGPGSARAWRMSFRRSDLSRSNSPASRRGVRTISASRASPSSSLLPSAVKPARALSHDDSLPTSIPRRSVVSANVGRIQPARAGHQHLRGQPGEPGVRLVLGRRAGIGQEMDAHQLAVGQRDEPHAEAVVEALVRERRGTDRAAAPRRPAGRAIMTPPRPARRSA